jgi:hypothetical protein
LVESDNHITLRKAVSTGSHGVAEPGASATVRVARTGGRTDGLVNVVVLSVLIVLLKAVLMVLDVLGNAP